MNLVEIFIRFVLIIILLSLLSFYAYVVFSAKRAANQTGIPIPDFWKLIMIINLLFIISLMFVVLFSP